MSAHNTIWGNAYFVLILFLFGSLVFVDDGAQAALIHHYQAENNANDSVGNHDGVEAGGVSYAPSMEGLGQAFNFSGDGGSNIDTNEVTIPESGSRTIAFWMKSAVDQSTSYNGNTLHVPVSQGHGGVGLTFQFGSFGATNLVYCCRTGGEGSVIEGYLSDDLDWHHIAVTYNGNNFENKIYVDSVLTNTHLITGGSPGTDGPSETLWIAPATSNGNTLRLGTDDQYPGRTYNGLLDDVRIYDNELSANEVAALLNITAPIPDISIFWKIHASGDWNDAGNWSGTGAPPVNPNQSAIFGDAITTLQTVFTNADVSVNDVQFVNSATYIVSGGGTIHLTAGTSAALPTSGVTTALGTHQFQAAVQINNDATVEVPSGAAIIFNNALNLMGNTLTKTGPGEMAINNVLTTVGGAVKLLEGSISGHGTLGGDVNNDGGTISPGNGTVIGAVPEPTGLILAIFGLLGILILRIVRR